MKDLVVFCEGNTERGFCKQVLEPHLFPQNDRQIHTLAVGRKDHHHLYGMRDYKPVRKFITNTLKERKHNKTLIFTSMIDLYALPSDFPGKTEHKRNPSDPAAFVLALEKAFGEDIGDRRFLPHLQLHEYETLLFADPEAFTCMFEDCQIEIAALMKIAAAFPSIEHINDSKDNAPSKRIIEVLPEYRSRKTSAGPAIAAKIGLPVLRQKCPHFHLWLTQLETSLWAPKLT